MIRCIVLGAVLSGCIVSAEPHLILEPTFENCSVRLVDSRKTETVKLQFREKGKDGWADAPDLVRLPNPERTRDWKRKDRKVVMPYRDGEFRGSILLLKEGGRYEVRAILRPSGKELRGTFQTLSSRIPAIAETIYIEDLAPGSFLKKRKGTPDSYIRLTSRSNDFVLTDDKRFFPAVLTLEDCAYLLIDGIHIRGGNRHALWLRNCSDIRIVNCEFEGNSRNSGYDRDGDGTAKSLTNGRTPHGEGALTLKECRNILVERCFIHTPASSANSWFHSHPFGPMAIATGNCGGGIVIRYNDLAGSHLFRYDDVIGGGTNNSPLGGFAWNADIYGNFFLNANDDGIELDGGQSNVRCYRNRFISSYCGISTAPCIVGPCWLFDNLLHDPGDENGRSGAELKTHFGDMGTGRIVAVGNTINCPPPGGPLPAVSNPASIRLYARGNVMTHSCAKPGPLTDMDHNLAPSAGAETHGIAATPQFRDARSGDFRLKSGSPGTGTMPQITGLRKKGDDPGAFPHPGAPDLPYRPFPVITDRSRIEFSAPERMAPVKVRLSVVPGKQFQGTFRIRKSPKCDYLSVSPGAGILRSGKTIELTVRLLPEKVPETGLLSDAFFVRFDNGFSRPVFVRSDLRKIQNPHRDSGPVLLTIPAVNLTNAGKYPHRGNGVLFSPADCREPLAWEFELPRSGRYYFFWCGSTSGIQRNLFEFSLNGDAYRPVQVGIYFSAPPFAETVWRSLWRKSRVTRNFESFQLPPGRHVLRLRPLRPVRLEALAVTDTPGRLLQQDVSCRGGLK